MARTKATSKQRAFVGADLRDIRLFSENLQALDSQVRPAGAVVQAQVTAASTVGIGFGLDPDGTQLLSITHAYRVELKSLPNLEALCQYESEYRTTFVVTELEGIDTGVGPVSLDPIHTYIQQVAWIARTRAQGTLGQSGFGGIMLPKQDRYTTVSPDAITAPSVTPAAAKKTKGAKEKKL